MQFGEKLRRAREEKKLTLSDAEAATKIRASYLEALEKENIPVLPGKAYAIGFLKTYAKFLDIAHEEFVTELKAYYQGIEAEEQEEDTKVTPLHEKSKLKNILVFAGGLILIGLLIIVVNLKPLSLEPNSAVSSQPISTPQSEKINTGDDEGAEKENAINKPAENKNAVNNKPAPSQAEPPASGSQSPAQGQKVVLRAIDRVWISVSADNKKVFEGIILKGQEKTFTGKIIKVKMGNAFAVNVIHNGNDLGILGTDRKVITKIFTE